MSTAIVVGSSHMKRLNKVFAKDGAVVVNWHRRLWAAPTGSRVRLGDRVPVLEGEAPDTVVVLGEQWAPFVPGRAPVQAKLAELKAAGRWNVPVGPILPRR